MVFFSSYFIKPSINCYLTRRSKITFIIEIDLGKLFVFSSYVHKKGLIFSRELSRLMYQNQTTNLCKINLVCYINNVLSQQVDIKNRERWLSHLVRISLRKTIRVTLYNQVQNEPRIKRITKTNKSLWHLCVVHGIRKNPRFIF